MSSAYQQEAQKDIESIKQFLLKNNPSKINADNQNYVLNNLAQCLQDLFVHFSEKSGSLTDRLRLLLTDTFSIWVLRTTQVVSNKKTDTSGYLQTIKGELPDEKCTTIFRYVLDFWTDGNSAFINALKDLFSKFLRLVRILRPTTECNRLFSLWLDKTLEVPSSLPVQYHLIDALAGELDLYAVLEKRPDFIDSSLSLMRSDALSNSVGRCLSRFLLNVYETHLNKEPSAISDWLVLWQEPILNHLRDSRIRKAIELYVLTPVFRDMPKSAFTRFVQNIGAADSPLLLSIFKLGQELAIEEEPFHDDRLIRLQLVEDFLKQDDFKLQAFELLTFSTKKSMPIRPYVFSMVTENLTPFFVDTQIEIRNYFCSSFKHFLNRIRDSAHACHKSAMSLRKANKFPEEQRQKIAYVEECKAFIEQILSFLKIQICPGTQYQRNDAAFKLFNILIESGVDESISEKEIDLKSSRKYPFSIPVLNDKSMIRLLFDSLASNYPDIRNMAKHLLSMALNSAYADKVREYVDWEAIEAKSIFFLKEYQHSDIGAVLQDVLYRVSTDKTSYINSILKVLHEKVVRSKGEFSRKIDQSVNGYLNAINIILLENEFDLVPLDSIVEECIAIVFDNWKAVKHVICHDSDEEKLHLMYPDGSVDIHLILSTAFKTTKESSQLLQTLIQKYPLSQKQLTDIGDFLINQLFTIRHSGAFQSVSPTFLSCCLRSRDQSPELLSKWLENILKSLEIKTQNVTRRSGGIPSLLTTILATESTIGRPLLKHAVEVLLRIASVPVDGHQDRVDLPQVNAFNCLRAIFIESRLSEACDEYASKALELSLKNFDSEIWALRNCSIMLFTSLQNRLFGKKGRSVSARLFFTRYQGVRETLLEILRCSMGKTSDSDGSHNQTSQVESIFLVLSVLLRLKPTPGYDGLQELVSEVLKCSRSPNWSIRELSAQVLSSIVDDRQAISIDLVKSLSNTSQNDAHGSLLVVKQFLSNIDSRGLPQSLTNMLFNKCREFIGTNPCFMTIDAYLSLMECILKMEGQTFDEARKEVFLNHVGGFFIEQDSRYAIDGSRQLCLANAIKTLLEFCQKSDAADICELGILSPHHEVQKAALQWLIENVHTLPEFSEELGKSIQRLANQPNILPSISALCLRALDSLDQKVDLEFFWNAIDNPTSEEAQLAAIECVGKYLPANGSEALDRIFLQFCREDLPPDYRISCFRCLSSYPYIKYHTKLLFNLHRMLSDDDEDIREMVANFSQKLFSPAPMPDRKMSPFVISVSLTAHLIDSCSTIEVQDNAVNQLKGFFVTKGTDPLSTETKSNSRSLFELEKDNLYRFELEHNMQYVKLLKRTGYDNKEFKKWVDSKQSEVTNFIIKSNIKDGPFGWASNVLVFSRLYILKELITLWNAQHLKEFSEVLEMFETHPVILECSSDSSLLAF